ncbi:hypothetical protein VTK56DRAFT_1564 [Thermocarpiscus australiensis]
MYHKKRREQHVAELTIGLDGLSAEPLQVINIMHTTVAMGSYVHFTTVRNGLVVGRSCATMSIWWSAVVQSYVCAFRSRQSNGNWKSSRGSAQASATARGRGLAQRHWLLIRASSPPVPDDSRTPCSNATDELQVNSKVQTVDLGFNIRSGTALIRRASEIHRSLNSIS